MPELPEVEVVRQTLESLVQGKIIDRVCVFLPRIVQLPTVEKFCERLEKQTIHKVERRGKFLRIITQDYSLVSHLRMEGRYGLYESTAPIEKHTHVIFYFTDGTQLRYKDVRQFGTMHLFRREEDLYSLPLKKLGVEPLSEEFTTEYLQNMLQSKKSKIKTLLLNQEYVVGLGNIYVDEILFRAKVHPESLPNQLETKDWTAIFESTQWLLKQALKSGGTSVRSYVNSEGKEGEFQNFLCVYGKKSEPCSFCNQIIEKIVVNGRGTHYCPSCQSNYPSKTRSE